MNTKEPKKSSSWGEAVARRRMTREAAEPLTPVEAVPPVDDTQPHSEEEIPAPAVQAEAEKPVQDKVQESAQEKTQEPVQDKVQEPVQEKAQEPVQDKVQELVQEKTQELVQDKAQEPAQEEVKEPVQEKVKVQEPTLEKAQKNPAPQRETVRPEPVKSRERQLTPKEMLALELEREREALRKKRERIHQQTLRVMETMYAAYQPFRQYPYSSPELELFNRMMKVFSGTPAAEANAHGAAALARAQEQLAEAPDYPDDTRAILLHGGIDPMGKYSELDMGFADRFSRIRAAANISSPMQKAWLEMVEEKMNGSGTPLAKLREEISTIARLQREHSRASRLCKSKEGARLLLKEAQGLEDCEAVRDYDAFLLSLEEMFGLKEKPSPVLAVSREALHRRLGVVVPRQISAPKQEIRRSSEFEVEFQNLENVFRNMLFSSPRSWEDKSLGRQLEHLDIDPEKNALNAVQIYLRATGLRALDVLFGEVESLPNPMSRADLILIEGKTLRELLSENAEVKKMTAAKGLTELTPELIRMKGAELVAVALLSGRRVEAWAPQVENGNVRLSWEPTPLRAVGYQPRPQTPGLFQLWQQICRQAELPLGQEPKPEERRVLQAQARERARNAVQLYYPNLQMELPRGYNDPDAHQKELECGQLARLHAREYVERVTSMAESVSLWEQLKYRMFDGQEPEPGAVSFCLGRLAALTEERGLSLNELLGGDSLIAEKDRLGEQYRHYMTTRSQSWYAENLRLGMRNLLGVLEQETAALDLDDPAAVLKKLPRLNVAAKALSELGTRLENPELRQIMLQLGGEEQCRQMEEQVTQVKEFFREGNELLGSLNRQYEAWQTVGEFDTQKLNQQREQFAHRLEQLKQSRTQGAPLFRKPPEAPAPEPEPEVEEAPQKEEPAAKRTLGKSRFKLFGKK